MNLFILDEDPVISAQQYCDIHMNKIILEAASCMCAAHWDSGFPLMPVSPTPLLQGKYRGRTHHNNHITKWVRASYENYDWTYRHAIELCNQHRVRSTHGREHASRAIVEWLGDNPPNMPQYEMTAFRQAVAPECYHENPVVAYWVYYAACKSHLATWKASPVPSWYLPLLQMRMAGYEAHEMLKEAERMYAYIKCS